MLKNTYMWTCITAVLAAWVYIDIFLFLGMFFVTIPVTVLSAIISIIISTKNKQPIFVFLNLIFAAIAVISIIVIPW